MSGYFNKFPIISYGGYAAINISERGVIRNNPIQNALLYEPYTIQHNERADQLATTAYDDPYLSYIFYIGNGITDPYYDWYMPPETFNTYLIDKYGSLQLAQQTVDHWRVNWYADLSQITPSTFSSLPQFTKTDPLGNVRLDTAQKYYEPILGSGGTTVAYARKESNNSVTTNIVVEYAISANTGAFQENEVANVTMTYTNGSITTTDHSGFGQVSVANSSTVIIQHCFGVTNAAPLGFTFQFGGANASIKGQLSGANATISSVKTRVVNISTGEAIYWTPVYVYDIENEKNENNKHILVLNPGYASVADHLLTDLLKP